LYFIKSPYILSKLTQKSIVWKMPTGNNSIYLTFDDGPHPDVTPLVLDILNKYDIKATFFCVGDNVFKHPEVFRQLLDGGHSIGNHTFNHLKGWKTPFDNYIANINKCDQYFDSKLFRPPYGKISLKQFLTLRKQYRIILWSVMSYDFKQTMSGEQCLKNVLNYTGDGSIIVFHDSVKAQERTLYTLPKVIEHYLEKGYNFKPIVF